MQIKITNNKIEERIEMYKKQTGATKTWIAEQLGMTKQRLYALFKADNMMLDVALRFSEFLKCEISDLFEYEVIYHSNK
jgi:DNA-binding Xre family transcriptional regulator